MGPGAAVPLPPSLQLLHPSDLQATSDQQEGFLHGGWQQNLGFTPSLALLNDTDFPPQITGSSAALSAHSERICQYLPDVSAEWGHLDPFLCVDGCR